MNREKNPAKALLAEIYKSVACLPKIGWDGQYTFGKEKPRSTYCEFKIKDGKLVGDMKIVVPYYYYKNYSYQDTTLAHFSNDGQLLDASHQRRVYKDDVEHLSSLECFRLKGDFKTGEFSYSDASKTFAKNDLSQVNTQLKPLEAVAKRQYRSKISNQLVKLALIAVCAAGIYACVSKAHTPNIQPQQNQR